MEVFTFDRATQGVTQLTFDGTPKSHPELSANCELLLYTLGDAEGKKTEVVLMELSTGRTTILTSGRREYGAIPTFSPDGRYVAYAEWQESGQTNFLTNPVLVLLDLVSKRKKYVTESSHESWRPVFSPDGRSLVFIANPAGQFDIYQTDLATGRILQLTATPYDEWDPSYSQSGQKVIYAGRRDGDWDLFLLDVQSRHEQRLTLTSGDEWDPVYGPGDESVFFSGEFGMFSGIYEMPFDLKE
jgi:Tol biopolymer transport system component